MIGVDQNFHFAVFWGMIELYVVANIDCTTAASNFVPYTAKDTHLFKRYSLSNIISFK